MEGLMLLWALIGAVPGTDFKQTKGSLMITGADMWRPWRAESVVSDGIVGVFSEPYVATHLDPRWRGPRNTLVLNQKLSIPLIDEEVKESPYKGDILKQLELLGVKLPVDKFTTESKSALTGVKAADLIHASTDQNSDPKTWDLVAYSKLVPLKDALEAPAVGEEGNPAPSNLLPIHDYSLMIEWGNPAAIERQRQALIGTSHPTGEIDSPQLQNVNGEAPPGPVVYEEAKVYDKHYAAYAVDLAIHVSDAKIKGETEAKLLKEVDGIYLTKPLRPRKGEQNRGYLWYYSALEPGAKKVVAIETSVFEAGMGRLSIEVPARCFLDRFIQPLSGRTLSLPFVDDTSTGTEDLPFKRVMFKDIPTLVLAFGFEWDTQGNSTGKSAEMRFFYEDDYTLSHIVTLSLGKRVTVPVTHETPKYIYDLSCNERVVDLSK